MNLFVYGTLLDPWIRRRVLGRSYRLILRPAILRGHRPVRLQSKPYPDAHAAPGSKTKGVVLCGLSPTLLARLDRYEGAEYRRVSTRAFTPSNRAITAQIYQTIQTVPVTTHRWTVREWKRRGGYGKFLAR